MSPVVQVSPTVQLIHRPLYIQLHSSPGWHIPADCLRLTYTQQAVVLPHSTMWSNWQCYSPQTQSPFCLLAGGEAHWDSMSVVFQWIDGFTILKLRYFNKFPSWNISQMINKSSFVTRVKGSMPSTLNNYIFIYFKAESRRKPLQLIHQALNKMAHFSHYWDIL